MKATPEQLLEVIELHEQWQDYHTWEQTVIKDEEEPPKGRRLIGSDYPPSFFVEANLEDAELAGADLSEVDLSFAKLERADLRWVNLKKANLSNTNLRSIDLRYANLQGADLQGADLWGANLEGADLTRADLRYANFGEVDLTTTKLAEVELAGVIGNGEEIQSMQVDGRDMTWTSTHLAIGLEQHSLGAWLSFSDVKPSFLFPDTLEYFNKWLPILKSIGVFDSVKRKETE